MDYLSEENWIEKSKALIYAEWSKFDIKELQVFETYLSRIDPRNPESSCVRFTKSEYAQLMGYASKKSLKTKTLEKWVRIFLTKQISIGYEGGTRHVNLFSDADVHIDSKIGEVVIDLDCNSKLKPVFFDMASTGYIKYRRKYSISFKSEYTLKLYCILKDHAWGNYEWTVNLTELRNSLGATDQLYERFAEFNRRILKRAQSEINDYSDITFEYERIVKGRLTKAIKFKIKEKKENIIEMEQMKLEDHGLIDSNNETPYEKYIKTVDPNEESNVVIGSVNYYADICRYKYNYSQTKELMLLLESKVREDIDFVGGYEMLRETAGNLLAKKLASLKNKEIKKSEFGLLKDMIIKDYN